ncbi:MAG TPA: hybrid sensor histidine kinase/response regulator [Gammaproteobacteria bacterium]
MSDSDTRKARILIIDDNQSIHKDFEKILIPQAGNAELKSMEADIFGEPEVDSRDDAVEFELDHALQGQEGYEMALKAQEEGRPYALAFVDMRMPPGWDGLETIEWLWRVDPDLQIIICSAYSDYTWTQISNRLGFGDKLFILQKPFSETEVLQFAHSLSEKRDRQHQASLELAKTHEELKTQKAHADRIERELVVSQKLKNAGELTSGVSHQINMLAQHAENNVLQLQADIDNVVNLLKLYRQVHAYELNEDRQAEVLTEAEKIETKLGDRNLENDIQNKLMQIMQATREMLNVTLAIKEFQTNNQPGERLVNINSMIINLLKMSRINYEYIAEIKTELGEVPSIYCNAGDMNQALTNLLMNAVHAIAVNDNINNSDNKGSIHISTAKSDNQLEIRIKDSGCGIPEEIRADIFKPFFTTRTTGSGGGHGLPIARHIIENDHGGSLSFETTPGHGTTFIVQLPIWTRKGFEERRHRS